MSNILFSVIVPTYNKESFIVKTIQSVLSQTYLNFELIIVDDGSTDNTEQVVKKIQDKRIKYYKKKNASEVIRIFFNENSAREKEHIKLIHKEIVFSYLC